MTYRQIMDRLVMPRITGVVRPLLSRVVPVHLLQGLGDHLVVCSEPAPADAVLVLGGGTRQRLDWGWELYCRGLAPRIVLTNSVDSSQLRGTGSQNSFEELRRLGAPAEAVLWLPWPRNTFEEAKAGLELASELGFGRLVVVTDPFHSRRVWSTFSRRFGGSGVELGVSCPPNACARRERWWERQRDAERVLSELLSLGYYRLRYGV